MTDNLSAAQQTQLDNRDSTGQWKAKTHAEADPGSDVLGIKDGALQPPFSEDDHIELSERLADDLAKTGFPWGDWYTDHNEDSKVSCLRSDDTDLEFSIGAEEHHSSGEIVIDCEAADDGRDLSGPHAWEGEANADYVASARSSYHAKTYDDAVEWANGKLSARLANDAWEDQMEPDSESLDGLAKREGKVVLGGMHRWSADETTTSEHLESHTAFSDELFTEAGYDDSAVVDHFGNSQQVYYGDGDPTDYVSTHFVVGVDADGAFDSEATGGYQVVHSTSANGNIYAEEGSWRVATSTRFTRNQAAEYARQAAQQDQVSGNIGTAHPYDPLLAVPSESHILTMDVNHTDGKLLLARWDEYDESRHQLLWQQRYEAEDESGETAWVRDL